jgi:hypothetical protein
MPGKSTLTPVLLWLPSYKALEEPNKKKHEENNEYLEGREIGE